MKAKPIPPWELTGSGHTRLDTAIREEFRRCFAVGFHGLLLVRCKVEAGTSGLSWTYTFERYTDSSVGVLGAFDMLFAFDARTHITGQPRLEKRNASNHQI